MVVARGLQITFRMRSVSRRHKFLKASDRTARVYGLVVIVLQSLSDKFTQDLF